MGVETTPPLISSATCLWNCCAASASHASAPAGVKRMISAQPVPDRKSLLAAATLDPVNAGPK
jgi:hypothetical protein